MTDNQFQELFRLVTNAVTTINETKSQLDRVETDVAEVKLDVAEVKSDVKELTVRVERVEQKNDDFREETNENFRSDRRELRSYDKRESNQNKEISLVAMDIEDLTLRVEVLEKKAA